MFKFSKFLYLPYILVYLLPVFGLVFADNKKVYFSFILIPIFVGLIFFLYNQKSINTLYLMYKHTPFKYFIYLYVWLILSGVFAVVREYYTITYFVGAVILGLFCRCFLIYLYPTCTLPTFISIKNFSKFLIVMIYMVLVIGLIEFFASCLKITPILDCINFFANCANFDRILIEAHSSIPRIKGLTAEPSAYAGFIISFLPFIYNFSFSKYKIYKNNILNLIIKKTIFPLSIICILLVQSPIGLIFATIVFIYICIDKIILIFKKYYLYIFIVIFFFLLFFMCITPSELNFSQTFLDRITKTLTSGGLSEFANVEPSLATRVLNWLNQFQIFLKHPIVGIGFLNKGQVLISHLMHTSLPKTYEMSYMLTSATTQVSVNMTTTSQLLFQTGIIGFLLYVLYMMKCIKYLNKISKYFYNLESVFLKSFKQHFIFIFINSLVYGAGYMNTSMFISMGLVNSITLICLCKRRKLLYEKSINNNTNL